MDRGHAPVAVEDLREARLIKRIGAALFSIALTLVVIHASPANALPCGDAHDATSTEATLNSDGSMDVVETLSFDFDSGCHGGIRELDLAPITSDDSLGSTLYSIGPLTVTERGESVPIADQRPGFVKWGEAGVTISGHHVYEVSYHVTDAVDIGSDVGVLYWQFLGTGSPHQDDVDVTIHTPGTGAGLRIFVHGALNGVSSLDGRDVHLRVDDNPKGTKVEVRMLEPTADFTAAPTVGALEQPILAKEALLADAANQRRADLRDELNRKANEKKAGNIASPIVAGLGLLAFAGIFFKWGKEPPPPADIGEYYREIPDDPPAVCQTLRSFGTVSNDAFPATLIDLAQRGWLTISEEHSETAILHRDKIDYRFTRTPKQDAPLTDYESQINMATVPRAARSPDRRTRGRRQVDPEGIRRMAEGFQEVGPRRRRPPWLRRPGSSREVGSARADDCRRRRRRRDRRRCESTSGLGGDRGRGRAVLAVTPPAATNGRRRPQTRRGQRARSLPHRLLAVARRGAHGRPRSLRAVSRVRRRARRRRATRRRIASALPAVRGGQQRFRDVVRRGQRGGLLELQPA